MWLGVQPLPGVADDADETVNQGSSSSNEMSWPIGSVRPQWRDASDWFTITTGGASSVSRRSNARPLSTGTPIALKYSGLAMCTSAFGAPRPAMTGRSRNTRRVVPLKSPSSGNRAEPPTAMMPGWPSSCASSRL